LARKRLERGAEDDALSAVQGHEGDFAAEGIAARIALSRAAVAAEAFEALDRGDRAAVGILTDFDPGDPAATSYRRRLATALY
jgi:thioredoxin-like negative regulator of GroEL